MSDYWNTTPQEPNEGGEPPMPEQPTAQTEGTQPSPEQPPYNGWSSDGSYRYVPPHDGTPSSSPAGGNQWFNVQPPSRPPRKQHSGLLITLAVVCSLAVIASVVFLGLGLSDAAPSTDRESTESSVSADETVNKDVPSLEISDWDDNDGGLSYKEIVNRNFDTTVVITAYAQKGSMNFGESNLAEVSGSSGIIMSEDGYIITNWHCVIDEDTGKPYDRIDVMTYDGTTYEDAQVIGSDESTDLAVIKIDATNLTVAQFGDSSTLAVGDRVAALGNAAGLSWTATFGYVSALARDVYDDTGYAIKCLQVDAAINPGNSGGALLNNQGLVVGINSAKIAATGYEGLGFSIPINEAKVIIDSLLKYGYVKGRVALGVIGQTVSSGMYNGFLITEINDGSCLEGTDVQSGDLIVAVDDVEVLNYGDLRAELAKHNVGDKVTLELLRSGRSGRVTSYTVTVELQEQKSAN